MLNSSPFIQPLALAIATVTLATGTPAFAQSKTSPIEITDCITITGVTQDTYYVLTTDLTNCPSYFTRFNDWTFSTNLAGYYAAIEVTDNTGRVMIDLNGRTLSGGTGLVRTGVLIRNSPKAAIKGNYHSRKDSGTWGATLSSFTTGISVRGSDGVSLGHSGVANGGIYVNDNERGLAVYQSDRLYMNHMSFSRSAELGAEIVDSDSPIIRAVNFNPLSGTGLALYDSPNATIWGSSGRTHANTYGLALHEGSDDAVITSWKAHRAYLASPMVGGRGVEPAGIYVAADGVEVDSAVFSQTGAVNTCDLYIDAAVTDDPTISSATVY